MRLNLRNMEIVIALILLEQVIFLGPLIPFCPTQNRRAYHIRIFLSNIVRRVRDEIKEFTPKVYLIKFSNLDRKTLEREYSAKLSIQGGNEAKIGWDVIEDNFGRFTGKNVLKIWYQWPGGKDIVWQIKLNGNLTNKRKLIFYLRGTEKPNTIRLRLLGWETDIKAKEVLIGLDEVKYDTNHLQDKRIKEIAWRKVEIDLTLQGENEFGFNPEEISMLDILQIVIPSKLRSKGWLEISDIEVE
jgi:hypothetical protein